MKSFRIDAYDGMNFFGGLVFFAPVALLVRTQAALARDSFSCCRCCSPPSSRWESCPREC